MQLLNITMLIIIFFSIVYKILRIILNKIWILTAQKKYYFSLAKT